MPEALAAIPAVPPREIIGAQVRKLKGGEREDDGYAWADFEAAVNDLAPPTDLDRALLTLTRESADMLRNRAAVNPSDTCVAETSFEARDAPLVQPASVSTRESA